MSSTVSMRGRARMIERLLIDPPADLPFLYTCLTHDVAPANAYGLMLSEPLIGAYARVSYATGGAKWQSTGFGEAINRDVVLFPTATLDWGLLQGWAMTDSAGLQAGNVYFSGSLQTPIYVRAGMQMALPERSIAVQLVD